MTGKSWNKNMDNIAWKQRLVLKPCHDFYFICFSTGTEFPVLTDLQKGGMNAKKRGKEKWERKEKGEGKTKGEREK